MNPLHNIAAIYMRTWQAIPAKRRHLNAVDRLAFIAEINRAIALVRDARTQMEYAASIFDRGHLPSTGIRRVLERMKDI